MKEYNSLSFVEKEKILWRALDIMKGYNNRTTWDAVASAMGYIDKEGEGKYEKRKIN